MMQLGFDGELKGSDDKVLPVFCEVQQPYVGGQKTQIRVAVPAQFISSEPPANACTLSGKCGAFTVNMQGVHWRCFPTSSRSNHGLEAIELLHVERLTVTSPSMSDQTEFQFHLGPVSYLREEYSNHAHGDKSGRQNLLVVDHPRLGGIRFVTDWVTLYNRASESFGATLVGGICAIVNLPASTPMDEERIVAEFKSSLEVLSLLFRQAVVLHGWTYSRNNQTITTWVAPMDPIVTPTFREERGDLVAPPQDIVQYASELTHA